MSGKIKWRSLVFREISGLLSGNRDYELLSYVSFSTKQFTPVKENVSVFNEVWTYWNNRVPIANNDNNITTLFWKRQSGKCLICRTSFVHYSQIKIDQKDGINVNKTRTYQYDNLQLVHFYCYKKN